jgi:hypothetical protein
MKVLRLLFAAVAPLSGTVFFCAAAQPNKEVRPSAPPGWSVSGTPTDPELGRASVDQLIDQLSLATPDCAPHPEFDSFWPIGGHPNLGSSRAHVLFTSPAAVELVRRGLDALPQLLAHLTDARRTKLIYAVDEKEPRTPQSAAFGDDYDPRGPDKAAGPSGVNTGARTPLNEDGTYTFKMGDICFVIVGQIVGRGLYAVHTTIEDADILSGMFPASPGLEFQTIDSPVARPALAEATRAEWHGLTAAEHEQLLQAALHRPPARRPFGGFGSGPSLPNFEILARLLYYYPAAGTDAAERLLRRKIVGAHATSTEDTATFWTQAQVVRNLPPFHSERLDAALLDLFHHAVADADAELKLQPNGQWEPSVPSLGSDVALACAEHLAHTGHDEEFVAYFERRIAAIEQHNQSLPSPGGDLGTGRFVNTIQVQNCRKFLTELEQKPANAPMADAQNSRTSAASASRGHVRLGAVTAVRKSYGFRDLEFGVELLDPAPSRVLVSRLVITSAMDDVGVTLLPASISQFAPTAVGMRSLAELTGFPKPTLAVELSTAAPKAKSIQVEGRVELVVPDLDPDAVVVVDDLATQFDHPLASAALEKAGITITLLAGKGTAESPRFTGPPKFDMAEMMEARHTARGLAKRIEGMGSGDVAVEMTDPNERFIRVEFQNARGESLRYNHNGWYHAGGDAGARVDVYRLGTEIPPQTRMVCWLITPKALVSAPLKLAAVPIR